MKIIWLACREAHVGDNDVDVDDDTHKWHKWSRIKSFLKRDGERNEPYFFFLNIYCSLNNTLTTLCYRDCSLCQHV